MISIGSLDAWVALSIAAAAAAWLAVRAVRALRGGAGSGACACPDARSGCGRGGPGADAFREAAARAAARLNRPGEPDAR